MPSTQIEKKNQVRILVVEDSEDIRGMLATFLESSGYNAMVAENGRSAMDLLKGREKPQLILLDLHMPEMDAVAFRAIQERDPGIADIPVLIISAESDLDVQGLRLGLNQYIKKPIDLGTLLPKVQALLSRS